MATIFTLIFCLIITFASVGGIIFVIHFFKSLFGRSNSAVERGARDMLWRFSTHTPEHLQSLKEQLMSCAAKDTAGIQITVEVIDHLLCRKPLTKTGVRNLCNRVVRIKEDYERIQGGS